MKLYQLVPEKSGWRITGDTSIDITKIVSDSRRVVAGSAFVAVRGYAADGHRFIDQAIESGAIAVVAEHPAPQGCRVCWIETGNSREAVAWMAAAFHGHPSKELELIGVTGTNGKTTVATLMNQLFTGLGYRCGLLSTVEYSYPGWQDGSTHTTPDPIRLNELLREMVEAGCTHAFMEVSSHAADQDRIYGLTFRGGVFTNITHDHLDYHKTFKAYIEAKKKFFDQLDARAFALVNTDDPRGKVMVQSAKAEVHTFALRGPADFHAKVLEDRIEGLHLQIDGFEVYTVIGGGFNAYNLLAVYGVAITLGEEKQAVLSVLSALQGAPGRMELVRQPNGVTGVVDYAHTPDALEQVLKTLAKAKPQNAQIITVVGCGGDRDKAKRPVMARIATRGSDRVILTSDNPRSEDPEQILRDMWEGLDEESQTKAFRVVSRKEAIRLACDMAKNRDVVLVAGKGHEKYQEVNGVKTPFDDLQELKAALLKDI